MTIVCDLVNNEHTFTNKTCPKAPFPIIFNCSKSFERSCKLLIRSINGRTKSQNLFDGEFLSRFGRAFLYIKIE